MSIPSDVVYRNFEWVKVESIPAVYFEFDKPLLGYWNGTIKGGAFRIECVNWIVRAGKYVEHPGPGAILKWGCFAANFWFTAKSGRSWKEAAAIARRCISLNSNLSFTTEIVFEDARFDMDAFIQEEEDQRCG